MIGIVSVAAYNPASAWMKQRSDEIENTVFGGRSNPWGDLWLRQKSVDGQAIIHAHGKEAGGTQIQGVEVFNFDDQGNFTERVDAELGELHNGYWELHNAKVVTPGFETLPVPTYLLATTLNRQDVAQAFAAPETVSFWRLPGLADQTAKAGLDPTADLLKISGALARPVLLAAMVLVAVCFSLRFFRMGGVEVMGLGGVAAGFVLYVATKAINDLGEAGFISPVAGGRRGLSVLVWRICFAAPRGWSMGSAVSSRLSGTWVGVPAPSRLSARPRWHGRICACRRNDRGGRAGCVSAGDAPVSRPTSSSSTPTS